MQPIDASLGLQADVQLVYPKADRVGPARVTNAGCFADAVGMVEEQKGAMSAPIIPAEA